MERPDTGAGGATSVLTTTQDKIKGEREKENKAIEGREHCASPICTTLKKKCMYNYIDGCNLDDLVGSSGQSSHQPTIISFWSPFWSPFGMCIYCT